MPIIKWRDSYSVGVKKFDDEHKVLINLINEMFIVVRDSQEVDHLDHAVGKLIQYTHEHFSDEEQALEEVNYPLLTDHKAIHSRLIEEVKAYEIMVDKSDEKAMLGFYHFLRDWLLTHILEEDMQYKEYFVEGTTLAA